MTSLTSSHILRHLPGEGFMTVLQSVCSHGHKLQFGDVQQALTLEIRSSENNHSSSECLPMEVPGESREVWVQLLTTVTVRPKKTF